MHIAFFLQFYRNADCPASDRYYALLEHLARKHRVTLLTTRYWHDRRTAFEHAWVPPGVTLHMFDVPYRNEMGAARRLASYGGYASRAFARGLSMARPDVIVGSSTPLSAAWVAAAVARLRRVPWVFEVQDLWPAFPIQMGAVRSSWLQRALRRLERRLYARAAHVVALSPDMKAHIRACGAAPEHVSLIHQGTNLAHLRQVTAEEVRDLRRQHGLSGATVVFYAGSFGRANDIPTLIEAARALQHRRDLQFVFMGQGYYASALQAAAQALSNLRLLPSQPYFRTLTWFKLADLALVPFIDLPVLAANAPAKLFDSLAAGTPVVVTNAGWTKALVERHRCGWYVPASDPPALRRRIEHLAGAPTALEAAGRRGQDAIGARFGREAMVRQVEAIIEQAGPPGGRSSSLASTPPPDEAAARSVKTRLGTPCGASAE